MRRSARAILVAGVVCALLAGPVSGPPPARANLLSTGCGILGSVGEGWLGKACGAITDPGKILGGAKKILGGAGKKILSSSGALGIAAIVAWAVGGAHFVLSETGKLIGQTTTPELTAAWFSSVYWRVAAVATLLTLPFLCAAAIQAILRSDAGLLARAVFGYLPLAFLSTAIAAPIAMLLLGLTDWMGASVAAAAGGQGSHFLTIAGVSLGALGVAAGSPFVTFLTALLTAGAGLVLWLELLIREAAVYVVVLMLPLVFCAMVWPARRVWAVRAVEVLVALILSKFAIVSVLSLAAAALGHSGGSLIVKSLAGLVLVMLGAFAPWVLLRLLPLAEVASAAVGHVRGSTQARLAGDAALGSKGAAVIGEGSSALLARMRAFAVDAGDTSSRLNPRSEGTQPAFPREPMSQDASPRSGDDRLGGPEPTGGHHRATETAPTRNTHMERERISQAGSEPEPARAEPQKDDRRGSPGPLPEQPEPPEPVDTETDSGPRLPDPDDDGEGI